MMFESKIVEFPVCNEVSVLHSILFIFLFLFSQQCERDYGYAMLCYPMPCMGCYAMLWQGNQQ